MSTSKLVTALSAILIASAAGLAVAGPPTAADAGHASDASRRGGGRVEPVHLPTGPVGNQPAPERSESSPARSAVPDTPLYQDSQRHSSRAAASDAAARRRDAAAGPDSTDKLENSEIQQVTSQQAEAERLRNNVAKGREDRVPKHTSDAIFGQSAPRGPARSASGVSRSSTIGASGIVPPQDSDDSKTPPDP
jgi:hypothetical protein